jgi:hypothetical protein
MRYSLSETASRRFNCTISNIRSDVNLLFSANMRNHACRGQKLMGPGPYLEKRLRFSPVGGGRGGGCLVAKQVTQCFYRTRVPVCSSHACH